jgi:LysR family glycine cleavage system transcriptional activator
MNTSNGSSDRWLRVFVAAARAPSFTVAADRLGITQSAVSHAVSRLESSLGVGLFHRSRSGAVVTDAGELLAERASAGFALIDRGLDAMKVEFAAQSILTVSVSTSLATHWLLPRLADFKRKHPEVDLRCLTSDTDKMVGRDGADLWIPLGRGPWPGFHEVEFCAEEMYPVASPELLSRHGLSVDALREDQSRLLGLPMLHLEERYNARFDWMAWFEELGIAVPRRIPGVISNDYSLILQAALDGQGVALGWNHIVNGLVESGKLFRLSAESITTDDPFVILSRTEAADATAVALFRKWLIGQA